jgi:transcriptional regulator with XRE-family HTH domain
MRHKYDKGRFLKAVGHKLYRLRKEKKKEVDAVGKDVRISAALLMRIERGDYDMYLDQLFELCDYYEITPHDFFKDVENELRN